MTKPLKFHLFLSFLSFLLFGVSILAVAQGGKNEYDLPPSGENAPLFKKMPPNSRIAISDRMQAASFSSDLSNASLQLKKRSLDPSGMEHVKFRQTHHNLTVEGAAFGVHLQGDQVRTINGILAHDIENYTPNIVLTQAQALQAALQFIDAEKYAWESEEYEQRLKRVTGNQNAGFYPEGEKVILSPQIIPNIAEIATAYRFDIYALQPLQKKRVYVNAENGEIMTHYDMLYHADVSASGQSNYYGTCHFTADSVEASSYYLRESGRGGGIITYNAAFDTSYAENHFVNSDNVWAFDPTAVDVHWGTEKTYDYFWEKHNRNSFDDAGSPLLSWVHFNLTNYGFSNNNNAFWNGLWMTYGDGDGIDYGPFTSLNIVAHEITHGVIEHSADLMYWYESGALSESFGDIFAEAVEYHATGGR